MTALPLFAQIRRIGGRPLEGRQGSKVTVSVLRDQLPGVGDTSGTRCTRGGSRMSRMLKWERLALQGDFSAMPVPFRWENSARFAHFLNGYEVAGGFDPLAHLANGMSAEARETGRWRGGALDLWLCLFFEHRAQRHAGSDYSGTPILEQLCETLRIALSNLSPRRGARDRLEAQPWPVENRRSSIVEIYRRCDLHFCQSGHRQKILLGRRSTLDRSLTHKPKCDFRPVDARMSLLRNTITRNSRSDFRGKRGFSELWVAYILTTKNFVERSDQSDR